MPHSALLDLCIQTTCRKVPIATLKAWALARMPTKGPQGGGMTSSQRSALDALAKLQERSTEGARRFEAREVAREGGLLFRDAYLALRALQGRGLVTGQESPDLDRWERPVSSFWERVAS